MPIEFEPFDRAEALEELCAINEALVKLQTLSEAGEALITALTKYRSWRDRLLPYVRHRNYCTGLDYHGPADLPCSCGLKQLLDEMRAVT